MTTESYRLHPPVQGIAQSSLSARVRRVRAAVVALVMTLVVLGGSGVAWGYVIFMKDGSQLTTREKYKVEGDLAIMQLQSGVTTSLPLAEIDIEKTERENARSNLGSAQVLEGFDKVDQVEVAPPPPPRDSLADVLRRRKAADKAAAAVAPAPRAGVAEAVADTVPQTTAGFIDLVALERKALASSEVDTAIREYLRGQGMASVEVFQGTESKQPLVEMVTESEPLVFKALRESAGALVQIQEQFPGEVEAFELLLLADTNGTRASRAGQFQMTPALADLLISGQVTPPEFFLRYVEF